MPALHHAQSNTCYWNINVVTWSSTHSEGLGSKSTVEKIQTWFSKDLLPDKKNKKKKRQLEGQRRQRSKRLKQIRMIFRRTKDEGEGPAGFRSQELQS